MKTTTSPKKGPRTLMKKTTKSSLSNYERRRLVNIKRNQEYLQELGLEQFKIASTDKIKKTKKKIEIGIITRRQQPHRSGKKQIRENDVVLPPPKKKQKVISTRRQPHRSAKKQIQLDLDKDEHKDIPSIVMFQPDTAMEMSNVITRMLEIGIVTPTQVAVRGFSVRLAEKSDLSASTKKDLQQQTLRLCKYGLLARWVLQDGDDDDDDDNRVLQIIRCSGIEGHHPSSKSSWVNERSNPSVRNHRLYNNGPLKKESFFSTKPKWLMKMCSRKRAGPVDRAPLVHGEQQNVECLIGVSNGCQSAFGAPTKDDMNGEIKLTTGVLGLNTQDGVDMILNTPIINDGSNGKLVLLIITIEEPSKLKPMLHHMSKRKKKSTFMAAKHVTLAGNRTSDQSRELENEIHRMQMVLYNKGLGSLTYKERRANYDKSLGSLTYKERRANYDKSLGLLTYKERRANGLLGGTKDGQWMGMYQKLVAYKKQYKSTKVPRWYTNDPQFGMWIANQRVLYKKNKLSNKRTELLNSINFVWSMEYAKGVRDGQWMGMYQKLVAYKKQYKSTKVPRQYTVDPQLGKWVDTQRGVYKKNKLLDKRTELLNSINFVWSCF